MNNDLLMTLVERHEYELVEIDKKVKAMQALEKEEQKRFELELNDNKDKINQAFIDSYYWETDLAIKPLAAVFGMSSNEFTNKKISKEYVLCYQCPCCKCELTVIIKNRNELRDIKSFLKEPLGNYRTYEYFCDRCKHLIKRLKTQKNYLNDKDFLKIAQYKTMPYKEYLLTPYWKWFADEARRCAHYKCNLCNGSGILHVHHKTYETRGEEKFDDVIVLCDRCHAKFHDKPVREENYLPMRELVNKKMGRDIFQNR
jgi:5-methylcytosine-specific restriction endonuclease McrA